MKIQSIVESVSVVFRLITGSAVKIYTGVTDGDRLRDDRRIGGELVGGEPLRPGVDARVGDGDRVDIFIK
jgi:hypothetical protein